MSRIVVLLTALLILGACSSSGDENVSADGDSTASDPGPDVAEDPPIDPEIDANAPLLAAALEELVTNDHTFGDGPPPFTDYLIQSVIDPTAGSGRGLGSERSLSDAERAAIEEAISPFGPIRWIDDVDAEITENRTPADEGAAILGVGEPVIDGDTALVGVSLWCGGVCGTWLTYELELVDGTWQVTGIDGPVAVS